LNRLLIHILDSNIDKPLTYGLAMDICQAATELPTLITACPIDSISPELCRGFVFAIEKMEDIADEIKPLHRAHWEETEEHRHELPFNPDYATFRRHERAGRYVLFTMRKDHELVGNCAMYLTRSAHTQTMMAKEDTLYLLPEARVGRNAFRFVNYVERALFRLGAKEINITVKVVNVAGKFFRLAGYRHVEDGLTKILEAEHEAIQIL
jgi:hypothetical protein